MVNEATYVEAADAEDAGKYVAVDVDFPDKRQMADAQAFLDEVYNQFQPLAGMNGSEPPTGAFEALTEKQERYLRTAYERGYFEIPRKNNQVAVSDELGVSHQSFSKECRRGLKALIEESLPAGDISGKNRQSKEDDPDTFRYVDGTEDDMYTHILQEYNVAVTDASHRLQTSAGHATETHRPMYQAEIIGDGHDRVSAALHAVHDTVDGFNLVSKRPVTAEEARETEQENPAGLSDKQYEAIRTSTNMGYLDVPRNAELEDISGTLDISPPAVGGRLRHAYREVIESELINVPQ